MKTIKLLFLSCILLWAVFDQVQSLKYIMRRLNGNLSVDFMKLPAQTHQFEIGPNEIENIGPGAICTAFALQIVTIDFTANPKPPTLRQDMFENCENLTELTINGNKQHRTKLRSGVFQNLANLKLLKTKNFKIRRLTTSFFGKMNSLSTLSLPQCSIKAIDSGSFDDLKNVESLSLKNNRIALLPGHLFQNLSRLKTLDLSYNNISSLGGGTFDGLFLLESLDLRHNRIISFGADDKVSRRAFDDLKNVKTLSLSNNKIIFIPLNLFKNLSQMKKLDLSHNNITHLSWDEVDGLSSLEILELALNKINFFDADKIFKYMPNLKRIGIDSNTGNRTVVEKSARELKEKYGHDILNLDTYYYEDYSDENLSLEML